MTYRIAIAGAGMGGLAAATLLAQDGHAVTLFERFAEARPVGSGLVVQPVGLAVLDALGAGDEARSLGAPLTRMLGHSGSRIALDVAYRPGQPGLAMHRSALFHCLWQAATRAGVNPTTGHTATGTREGPTGIHFTTDRGDHGPFDLIVDASGAASRLSPLKAKPLPFGAVWAHVPWPVTDLPGNELRQRYHHASRMAGILPIGHLPDDPTPRAAIFWSLPAADLDAWPERDLNDWKAEVTTFWPALSPFLAQITDKVQLTPARYSHGTLAKPHSLRLIHIGDAAHRASPQLGQGANMALLDARALALALRLPLEDALPRYRQTRRWHLGLYQTLSAAFTPQYQSHSRALPAARDHLMSPLSRLWPLPRILSALVSGDLIPPIAGQPGDT
ncbi:MAG: NAD(P)/FAD-dependent oxidoreductase [Tabrizicola sp.]|uniref:FAD-dependent oxidoreductase n=1 Tax=Tabrizicola sp. TaxID=2005166 RepID=UPI002AB81C5A|nr:NAD(P)/FAD-dependent oxidoreductase [Tabrizicola sp.]MDZ4088876.1 NAD(P)/FAD-dependent oxidoreductase [Tabrizicola sp.]